MRSSRPRRRAAPWQNQHMVHLLWPTGTRLWRRELLALLSLALILPASGTRFVGSASAQSNSSDASEAQLPYWAVPPPKLYPRLPPYPVNPPLKASAVLPTLIYSSASLWGDVHGVRCASALPLRSTDRDLGAEALGDGFFRLQANATAAIAAVSALADGQAYAVNYLAPYNEVAGANACASLHSPAYHPPTC